MVRDRILITSRMTLVLFALGAIVTTASASGAASFGANAPHPVTGTEQMRGVEHPDIPQDNVSYHGGPVMSSKEISYAIFWLPPTLQDGSPTSVSPTFVKLIKRYLADVGGHGLYGNNTQYYRVVHGKQVNIRNRSSLGPVWIDTSPYPPSGCDDPATPGNCISDAQIRTEIGHAIDVNGWKSDLKRMFFLFTSDGEGSCDGVGDCAYSGYCAYHDYFARAGHDVIYANLPYLGTRVGSCKTPATPNGDIAADSTISTASHEQMESVTDPLLNAWYSPTQGEIADKCSSIYGPLGYGGVANEKWNGHLYIVQEEWSNSLSACTQGN